MNVVLMTGLLGLGLIVARVRTGRDDEVLGLPGMLLGIWSAGLLIVGLGRAYLDFSTASLFTALSPMILMLALSWRRWFVAARTIAPREPDRFIRWGLLAAFAATALIVVWDLYMTVSIARDHGVPLALSRARAARHAGEFYPTIFMVFNPFRMIVAPLGWVVFKTSADRDWRRLGAAAAALGVFAAVLTTGRAALVIMIVWMWGISYYSHQSSWGLRGLLKRISIIGAISAAFFIFYGVAIGKTHPAASLELPAWIDASPVLRSSVMLLIYTGGPLSALANSIEAVLSTDHALSLLYPVFRVLRLIGIPVSEIVYGLPPINIPFPINLYTFLGPGFWVGGLAGAFVYISAVFTLLIVADRRRQTIVDAPGAFFYGYLVAALLMSLASDYFVSMGFSYIVYGLVAVPWLWRRIV